MRDSTPESSAQLILPPSQSYLKLSKFQRKDGTEKPKLYSLWKLAFKWMHHKNGQSLSHRIYTERCSHVIPRSTVHSHYPLTAVGFSPNNPTINIHVSATSDKATAFCCKTCHRVTFPRRNTCATSTWTVRIPSSKPRRLSTLGFVSSCDRTFFFQRWRRLECWKPTAFTSE